MSTTSKRWFDNVQFWPFGTKWQQGSITVLSGILLVQCWLFVTISPATDYEPSLITSLPTALWICFYVVLIGTILTLVSGVATESRYWPHSLTLLLANYAIFIFLPDARGYKFYGRGNTDALAHMGWVRGIVETGSLMGSFYPAEHVLLSALTLLGIPFESLPYVSSFLFTAVYILGMGAFFHSLVGDQRALVGGLAAGTPLIFAKFHLSNHPSMNSFLLVPVILLVVERYRRTRHDGYLVLFVLFGLMIIYFHPVSTLLLVLIILGIAGYTRVHSFFTRTQVTRLGPRIGIALLPLLFAWLLPFDRTVNAIQRAVVRNVPAPAAIQAQQAGTVDFTLLQLVKKFVTLFGAVTLYLAVAGLFALFLLRGFLRRDYYSTPGGRNWSEAYSTQYEWVMPSVLFGLGTVVSGAFLFGSFGITGRIRVMRFALLFAVILVGLAILYTLQERKTMLTVGLAVIVILSAGLSANAAYRPGQHLTYAEYGGTQFLTQNNELGIDIHSMDTRHAQERYVLGSDNPRVYPAGFQSENAVPQALGYDTGATTAAETFGEAYLVTKPHDLRRPTAAYYTEEQQAFLTRYGPEHVERMHSDQTANKIYANGGFTGWLITPSDGDT